MIYMEGSYNKGLFMDNQFYGFAYRNVNFYGPIVISVLFFIQIFLSPHAIRSSSTLTMFFRLKQRIYHLPAS